MEGNEKEKIDNHKWLGKENWIKCFANEYWNIKKNHDEDELLGKRKWVKTSNHVKDLIIYVIWFIVYIYKDKQ